MGFLHRKSFFVWALHFFLLDFWEIFSLQNCRIFSKIIFEKGDEKKIQSPLSPPDGCSHDKIPMKNNWMMFLEKKEIDEEKRSHKNKLKKKDMRNREKEEK